uniref:Peripherin 2a (retinal degeneration, slow) n=1 Tax=Eptatretus burgeri TaxID=7764 RepID=A0A8C4QGT0_EPTBU
MTLKQSRVTIKQMTPNKVMLTNDDLLCNRWLYKVRYFKVELRWRADLLEPKESSQGVANFLLVLSTLACGLNLVAGRTCHACAAHYGRVIPTFWHRAVSVMIVTGAVLAITGLIAALACQLSLGSLGKALADGLQDAMIIYKDTDTPGRCFLKRTIDELQIRFQCCGTSSARDWFEVQWVSMRYLNPNSKEVQDRMKSNVAGRYLTDSVPFSCCNPRSPRPCIQHRIANSSAHYGLEPERDEPNLWARGCRDALLKHYSGTVHGLALFTAVTSLLQLFLAVGLRYLQTSTEGFQQAGGDVDGDCNGEMEEQIDGEAETIEKENIDKDKEPMPEEEISGEGESETEGWLLDRSVSESVATFVSFLKSVFRVNRVAAGATMETEDPEDASPLPNADRDSPTPSAPPVSSAALAPAAPPLASPIPSTRAGKGKH